MTTPSGISVGSACSGRANHVSTSVRRGRSRSSRRVSRLAWLLEAAAWMVVPSRRMCPTVSTPHCLGVQEAVHTEVLPCGQNGCAPVGHGVMSRMEAARQAVARDRRVGRPFHLAGTAGPCGVAITQQPATHVRRDGLATAWPRAGVESAQVPWRDHVADDACHMVRRQTCAPRDGGIEGGFVIGGCEWSAHVPSVRGISACGQRVLSHRPLGTSRSGYRGYPPQ